MTYTGPHHHPFLHFLKLTFFLWVLFLAIRLLWRTAALLVGSLVLGILWLVNPRNRPLARHDLQSLGFYWQGALGINASPRPRHRQQSAEIQRRVAAYEADPAKFRHVQTAVNPYHSPGGFSRSLDDIKPYS